MAVVIADGSKVQIAVVAVGAAAARADAADVVRFGRTPSFVILVQVVAVPAAPGLPKRRDRCGLAARNHSLSFGWCQEGGVVCEVSIL